ncbi:MAG: GntR family transcriptional regulator, partial [Ruthenibacterium sp.]
MADFLYNDVARQISLGIKDLPVGTKLPSERDMSVQYGVSRNVLREALRLLSEKGMLRSMPGKGVYVANDGKDKLTDRLEDLLLRNDSSLADIVEVRETLELGVMEKAIQKATSEDIHALIQLYAQMEKKRDDIEAFNRLDMKFHVQLAK